MPKERIAAEPRRNIMREIVSRVVLGGREESELAAEA